MVGGQLEWQGSLLQTGQVTSGPPFLDGSCLPINMKIMPTKPWKTKHHRKIGLVQNVKLECLVVITGALSFPGSGHPEHKQELIVVVELVPVLALVPPLH